MIKHFQLVDSSKTKLVPSGTLRGHLSSITSLAYFYIPSNASYVQPGSSKTIQVLLPTLLTGDELGWLIWWDLNIKRPLAVWKAHSSNVVTIRQLGLGWEVNGEKEQPIIDFQFYGKIMTHGKDSSIRIWNLMEILDETNLVHKFTVNFNRRLPVRDRDEDWVKPHFHEIPVNTLNYCNVDIYKDMLITPSTVNSNNFDIYLLPTESRQLNRIFKDVNLYEILNPLETSDRNFGIIMKMVFLDEERICVGFESGDVVLVSVVNFEIEILKVDSTTHRPSPILDMIYDPKTDFVITTSANDKVLFMNGNETMVKAIRHHGISSLSSRSDGLIGMVTWDGFTRIYDKNFEVKYKINKLSPSVKINDLNIEEKEKVNLKIKLVNLKFSILQANYRDLKNAKLLNYNNGTSKMIVRRREEQSHDKNRLCVGFNDGRIIFYDL